MTATTPPPQRLVEMTGIRKSFGGVAALNGIDLHVDTGEIVALLGDNGAGKSTLIKMLSGIGRPDSGSIRIRGKELGLRSARDAIDAGIETIYQGSALVDELSVSRNLFLGREPQKRLLGFLPRLDKQTMDKQSKALLKEMGLHRDVDPSSSIAKMSGGERQSIAIARAMQFEADLIILDEPTNNLGVEETWRVLQFIRDAKAAGKSSIFITHNIFHVFQVVDRAVILRRGEVVADLTIADTTIEEVERLITGTTTPV
ncbi:ATP-binding cassette domain-containing protein [Streptomyces sp. NBC_00038]|uniref:ATP-binding cassette domain-containing protein n=1 Tax=Streptomyces sp. NBC_00038 TaxID=2903615 RepID=UPI002254AF33|nr:ATP-binding cassette domain-containing protein [Streptomyces sp. NBC_00038]MCX5563554.1 ATP-binding cassette domain-containing protein [Streptomyces sp. NBC_00038]